jgi:hypothetical protein
VPSEAGSSPHRTRLRSLTGSPAPSLKHSLVSGQLPSCVEQHSFVKIEPDLLEVVRDLPTFGQHGLELLIRVGDDQPIPHAVQLVDSTVRADGLAFQTRKITDVAEAECSTSAWGNLAPGERERRLNSAPQQCWSVALPIDW